MVKGGAPREPSPREGALLALLRQAPRSGYDLRKLFALTPFVHFSDSPGAVYPALRKLERHALVASAGPAGRGVGVIAGAAARAAAGRRRRELRLTSAGRRALRQWLRTPVTRDELTRALDAPMLRFAFMEEVLGRPACATFLGQYEAVLGAYVAELRAYGRMHLGDSSTSGRLAFESGLAGFEGRKRWAERARRVMQEVRK